MNSFKRKPFNIHVVEDHNDALQYIYKDIGIKRLSFNNLTLIHFDSHPDLGIPSQLKAEQIFNKNELFEKLSIENWILPAVFAGHISRIIWIKPHWAAQLKPGLFKLVIGKNISNGGIACTCSESYFLSDNLYSNESSLTDKRQFLLYVCDFDSIIENKDIQLADLINQNNESSNLILDIDLDFFSTRDPFKEMFQNAVEYELYKRVYATKIPDFADSHFEAHYQIYLAEKNSKIQSIWEFLNADANSLSENLDLENLRNIFIRDNLDIEVLHEYGKGIDDSSLPHHISTNHEIILMLEKMRQFLDIYLKNGDLLIPGCLTIARSSLDDYCPPDQVDFIQNECLKVIQEFFTTDNIKSTNLVYKSE